MKLKVQGEGGRRWSYAICNLQLTIGNHEKNTKIQEIWMKEMKI